jgi:hypothetical protein
MWKNGIDERCWASKRLTHHLHKYFRRYKCIGDEDRDPTILRIMNPSSIFKCHMVNTYKPFNKDIDGYYLIGNESFDMFYNKRYWEITFEQCPHLLRYAFTKSIGIKERYCTPIYSGKYEVKRINRKSTDDEYSRHSSTLQTLDCVNRNKRYYPSDGEFGGDTMKEVPVNKNRVPRGFIPKPYCSIEPPRPNIPEDYSTILELWRRRINEAIW